MIIVGEKDEMLGGTISSRWYLDRGWVRYICKGNVFFLRDNFGDWIYSFIFE